MTDLDAETTETMLRVLHHAAAEHIRVWHGSIPTKDRAIETTPLRLLINAIDLAGEHLGEQRINHDKARQERKRAEYQRQSEAAPPSKKVGGSRHGVES